MGIELGDIGQSMLARGVVLGFLASPIHSKANCVFLASHDEARIAARRSRSLVD